MKFGAELVPYYSPARLSELGSKIEKAGLEYLWVTDHYHNRFVHSILTDLSNRTKRIKLGPGVTNPYLIHPTNTATAIATLDELSGGRATLGISSGDPGFLKSVGIEPKKPITAVREATTIIRKLLHEGKVDFSGEIFTCKNVKMGFSPQHKIPIYIGGRGKQMMKLAGETADGALFNTTQPEDLKECIEMVEKGARKKDRNLENFDKVAYMATSIDEDERKARERARAVTSFVATSAPTSTIERENISKKRIREIRDKLTAGDLAKAKELVTEKMIDVFTVAGDIDKLESRIKTIQKLDISQIVIGSPIGPNPEETIERIEKPIN